MTVEHGVAVIMRNVAGGYTAFVTLATGGQILWIGFSHGTVAAQTLGY